MWRLERRHDDRAHRRLEPVDRPVGHDRPFGRAESFG
jgi:hypothetical protein